MHVYVCMHSKRTFGQSPSQEADSTLANQQLPCSVKPKRSLPCSQEPANSPYPEPDVAHLRLGLPSILFLADFRIRRWFLLLTHCLRSDADVTSM
jgi:hypothetical protein